ncbi:hypothetical protein [Acrocarpospora catenulata]|uniref:hypothetical protein n=1 Tax=Acrocarpospora catenulata TaxID=2836182 RepID=UPI001BDAF526|nr:hypothetical protein [Acrocarpospora catenulata]
MPSEHSESQRTPAWPEVPPAWPEVPAASSPTAGPPPGYPEPDPYGQRSYRTGDHPVLPPPLNDPPRGGTDPFGRPQYREPDHPVLPPPAHEPFSTGPFGVPPGIQQDPRQADSTVRLGPRDPQPFGADPQPFGALGQQSPRQFGTGETPLYRAPMDQQAPPQQAFSGPHTGEHGVPQFPMTGMMAAQPQTQAPPQPQFQPQAPPQPQPQHQQPQYQPQPQPQQPPHQQPQQPADPYKPFVTAGQISGPKTPPAHRQQELWNTVFGENYQAIDEYDEEEERGRPIWLFALVGSVLVALIAALLWAFLAGPLAGTGEDSANPSPSAKPSASKSSTAPQAQGGLPVYEGTASPVKGTLTDSEGHVSLPQLGGPWRTDLDQQGIQTTYGYVTRQFVNAGMTTKGKPQYAQVMSGPLSQELAAKFTTADDLRPVINAVVVKARQSIFPKGNKVSKVGAQKLRGANGQLGAYKVTDDGGSTLVVVAAVNTGQPLPSIVYMQVPDIKDDLLPDVNTIFKSIKVAD